MIKDIFITNNQHFNSLADAYKAAKNGDTIYVCGDILDVQGSLRDRKKGKGRTKRNKPSKLSEREQSLAQSFGHSLEQMDKKTLRLMNKAARDLRKQQKEIDKLLNMKGEK